MEQTREQQQAAFVKAVGWRLAGIEDVAPGLACCCNKCRERYGYGDTPEEIARCNDDAEGQTILDEGRFSSSPCDSCGSTLGGDRFCAHGFDAETNALYHLLICVDCMQFHANGTLPETWEG